MQLSQILGIGALILPLCTLQAADLDSVNTGQPNARQEADAKLKGDQHRVNATRPDTAEDHVAASETKLDVQYDLDKLRCADVSGSSKDSCLQQAKLKHDKSKSLVEQDKPGADASKDAERPKQEAGYELARKACEKSEGEQKETCLDDAKQRYLK